MAIEQGRGRPLEEDMGVRPVEGLKVLVGSPVVLGLVIFLLALWPRITDLDVFVGPDEFDWLVNSAKFAQGIAGGDLAETYQFGYPAVTLMGLETINAWLLYGLQPLAGGPAGLDQIINQDRTMAMLSRERAVLAVAVSFLIAATTVLVHRLFGPGVAWLAGFLLAFDPFFLSESRTLRTEALVTAFSGAALFSYLFYLQKGSSRRLVLAGVLTGLALLTKVSCVALLPVGALVIGGAPLLAQGLPAGLRWRRAGLALLAWAGVTAITIFALWPALWVAPLDTMRQMYDYIFVRVVGGDNAGGNAFFMGGLYPHKDLSPLFYPMALLYRTGPLLWLGLILLGLFAWQKDGPARLAGFKKSGHGAPGLFWPAAFGALLLYLVSYLVLIMVSDIKFDRYVLPMWPAFAVLAAWGLVLAWGWLAARWPGLAGWGWLAALLVLAGQVALALPHHPYYYTYWNPLLGGPRQAVRVLPVGAGEGIDQVIAYLNGLPNAEQITLVSANSDRIKPIFKGRSVSDANLNGEWLLADYTFIYILQRQQGKHHPETLRYLEHKPLDYVLTLNGLEYGWLYRGPGAMYFGGDTRLEGRATLHAYDLSETGLTAGEKLGVRVYFRNEGQQPADRFYVRLVDAAGYVWAEDTVQPRPGFEEAFTRREAIVEGEVELALPVGMPPGEYQLKLGYENRALGEAVGEFVLPANAPKIRVEAARGVPAAAAVALAETELEWQAGELALRGYSLAEREWLAGEATWLRLVWQALAEVEQDYVIGLQLLDGTGQEAAYWLGRPVLSGYATRGWQAGQVVLDPWRLELPEEVEPGEYELGLTVYDAGTQAAVGQVGLGQVTVVERRRSYELPEMGRVLNVDLSEGIRLLGYDLHAEPLPGGGRLRVVLYWQGQAEVGRSYTVFVQMLDPAGVLVAQHDGLPVEGTVPTTAWAAGEVIADRHLVEFGLLGPGEYRLVVGLYDRETGERLSVVDGPDYIELEPVVIE